MEYTIREMVKIIKKSFIFIIVFTFLIFIVSFVFNKFVIQPSYTATAKFYVKTNESASPTDLNELTYAQKIVPTYINFLNTKVFYKKVLDKCKLSYNINEMKEMTTIQAVGNTEIFEISVTTNKAEDSYELVKAMEEIAPNLIKSIRTSANISIVDPALLPTSKSAPDVKKNTLICTIFGFLFSIIGTLIWYSFHSKD